MMIANDTDVVCDIYYILARLLLYTA